MSDNEENYKEAFGKKVEQFRLSKDFGLREFALIAGIEHHQLINIEKGRVDVRLSTLLKISKGLEIEPKDLLDF